MRKTTAAYCVLLGLHAGCYAGNSVSFEAAAADNTAMARIGTQWKWEQQWWQSNGTHIGGYWDLTLAYWRGRRFQNLSGNMQRIADIGITPVFRLQRDSLTGPYAEVGVGAHYLSDLYNNNGRHLSTHLEFGDHIGVGYVFNNFVDIGLKIQHFSNGGIKEPNDGVNFAVVRLAIDF